ncbi:PEP-CTERM sorting domain-containing protein [Methylotuvimicrobium sp. KM1]|uniref:PEP-CTERM sorting domain-containing protein n=1 Tax=Methylotuvimicrobium sp. KM1 TaxID=3377707 RepID=UPI00384E400C
MKTIETKINRPAIAAFALAAALFAGGSQAATLCSAYTAPDTHLDGLSVEDVTFKGNNANDCYGFIDTSAGPGGNPTSDTVWADTGWTQFAKDESGTSGDIEGTVLGIEFTLSASTFASNSGTWLLAWEKVDEPGYDLKMDVVANLKAANGSASYLFEDLTFTSNGNGSGAWEITFAGPGQGDNPSLSNMTLWYQNATSTPPNGGGGPGGGQVPEPHLILLMGIGLVGFGATKFRKTTKA